MVVKASPSKRLRFAGTTQTLAGVSELLEETVAEAEGVLEMIPVSKIVFDPDQPRMVLLSRTDPSDISSEDPNAALMREQLERLQELATSIQHHGLIEPIGVYLHGPEYRLIWGERRVLASILVRRDMILARILPERPNNLLEQQLIENIQREDLNLEERIRGIQKMIRAREEKGTPLKSASDLRDVGIGWSTTNAYAYWAIATGPADVHRAIREGVLTSVRQAYAIASMADANERKVALETLQTGEGGAPQVSPAAAPAKAPVKVPPRRGAPVKVIALGKTKSPSVARYVAERLVDEKEFAAYKDADWNDLRVANDILKQIIKRIEQRVKAA